MPPRSPNPVQKVQGYAEQSGTITLGTVPPTTAKVQKSFPGAIVQVFYHSEDDNVEIPAIIYSEDGQALPNNTITANPTTALYEFYAQSGRYDLKFSGTGIEGSFKIKDVKVESLIFNVRDYGAKGDGSTDDTLAIQAALDAMIVANSEIYGVGTLFFPNGRYKVSRPVPGSPFIFDLPSGIIIQGTAGPYSGSSANPNNCLLVLTSSDCSIFRIGTSRHKIIFRDLALTTEVLNTADTIAIDARASENLDTTYTSGLEFDNLTIWNFDRGISIEGSGTEFQWDITGVRINHCNITGCQYSIYVNSQNCSFMRIVDTRIGALPTGFGIYLEKVGIITIDSILGAGEHDREGTDSDTFIYLTSARATVTIINCECEGFDHSIKVVGPGSVGNLAWPILLLNCALGPEVLLDSQCDVVSVGNRYLPDTVQCGPLGSEVMLFSFGDVIIGLDKIPNPAYDFHLNSTSRIAARANRYRVDFQRPAHFGGLAGSVAPLAAETALSVAPFVRGQAQVALCNQGGEPLYAVRAELDDIGRDAIYFENARTGSPLMKLTSEGDLYLIGRVFQESTP